MTRYKIPIEIHPLQEGGYLASCPAPQGCHAEGQTIAEATDNMQDVARVLLELRIVDGLPIPGAFAEPGSDRTLRGEVEVAVGA